MLSSLRVCNGFDGCNELKELIELTELIELIEVVEMVDIVVIVEKGEVGLFAHFLIEKLSAISLAHPFFETWMAELLAHSLIQK